MSGHGTDPEAAGSCIGEGLVHQVAVGVRAWAVLLPRAGGSHSGRTEVPSFPPLLSPKWLLGEVQPRTAWNLFLSRPGRGRPCGEDQAFPALRARGRRPGLRSVCPWRHLARWGRPRSAEEERGQPQTMLGRTLALGSP